MSELDFSGKTVLVVGGSSGIGNGIAQRFRSKGASVHVWGTRTSAADYSSEEGSDLEGLHYSRVDVSDFGAIERFAASFDRLDVLILSQGIVLYGRKEFEIDGFQKIIDVNLNCLMACSKKFHDMLAARGNSNHPEFDGCVPVDQGYLRLQCLEDGRIRSHAHAGRSMGRGWYSR